MNTRQNFTAVQAADDSIRFAWALPILTGSVDDLAERRTLALAMALGTGLDGVEAIDVAIAATEPGLLASASAAHGGENDQGATAAKMLDPWKEGVLMAASVLIGCHDQPTMAATILHELGASDADCTHMDDFDKSNLRKIESKGIALRGLVDAPSPAEGA